MANYYRTKRDVAFPKVVAKIRGEGEDAEYQTEGVNYAAGSVVPVEHLTPRDQKRAESGELDHLLEPFSDEDARNYPSGESDFAIFVPEHEAEAHALEAYGHTVVPKEQELELLARSSEHHAEYQQAVRDAGYDRRPVQEALAQPREHLPAEIFEGAETRTGLPHNRGPERSPEEYEDEDEGEQSAATRPAPGNSDQGQEEGQQSADSSTQGDSENQGQE